ncbi:hypothetical protein GCM10023075_39520 [Streptosporangium album]
MEGPDLSEEIRAFCVCLPSVAQADDYMITFDGESGHQRPVPHWGWGVAPPYTPKG